MAYTTRNVSRLAHQPTKEKFLSGDVGQGIKSAGKLTQALKEAEDKRKAQENAAALADGTYVDETA